MFVEPTKNFEATVCDPRKSRIELYDLDAVVHTCHEQVITAVPGRVPLYTPDATPNMSLLERSKGFTCVKEANFFIITERESTRELRSDDVGNSPSYGQNMFDMGMGLNRGYSRFKAT